MFRTTAILTLSSLAFSCSAQVVETGPRPILQNTDLADAPRLFHGTGGTVTAKWIQKGKVVQKKFAKGEAIELPEFAGLLGKSLTLGPHKPPMAEWKMPEKIFVVSDVEGEYDAMFRFLRSNGVVDKLGKWSFGKGHFVCVGDMVDRGSKVTEVLWMLYRLSREAREAGGQLHYVLGNHEVMWMGGDVRYVAPKYRQVAALLGVPVEGLVGPDTELGRWMRSQNCLVRVGEWFFVHAGLSPQLAEKKCDINLLNKVLRSVIGVPPLKIRDRTVQAITWGPLGPLWYRGYFKEWELNFGPTPTAKQIDAILQNVGAKTIVVGHTKVPRVTALYERRVMAIDVPWTDVTKVRGLLIQKDKLEVVDAAGKRTPFR